jgi:hypothetical protein
MLVGQWPFLAKEWVNCGQVITIGRRNTAMPINERQAITQWSQYLHQEEKFMYRVSK